MSHFLLDDSFQYIQRVYIGNTPGKQDNNVNLSVIHYQHKGRKSTKVNKTIDFEANNISMDTSQYEQCLENKEITVKRAKTPGNKRELKPSLLRIKQNVHGDFDKRPRTSSNKSRDGTKTSKSQINKFSILGRMTPIKLNDTSFYGTRRNISYTKEPQTNKQVNKSMEISNISQLKTNPFFGKINIPDSKNKSSSKSPRITFKDFKDDDKQTPIRPERIRPPQAADGFIRVIRKKPQRYTTPAKERAHDENKTEESKDNILIEGENEQGTSVINWKQSDDEKKGRRSGSTKKRVGMERIREILANKNLR